MRSAAGENEAVISAVPGTGPDLRRLLWRRRLELWRRRARELARRFTLLAGALFCALLLVFGKLDIRAVRYVHERAGDIGALVMGVVRVPLALVASAGDAVGELLALRAENARLREENRQLLRWRHEAVRLAVENEALRRMLAMPLVEAVPRHTVARVVADSGSRFVHTRLVDAGEDRGVRVGMAVVDERGMVGRVIAVGRHSARVLLLVDLNSRIPVVVEPSGDRAILEGDNGPLPRLRFLPLDPRVAVGDRVVTSGADGLLPAGLPVGVITRVDESGMRVRPYVDWARLDYVTILDLPPVEPPAEDAQPAPPLAADLVAPGAAERRMR
ncbi:Cell shape-determining protein MreC [bacterium HR39]|nr:Cell shape-determining protein MreC [bacterium HR39]